MRGHSLKCFGVVSANDLWQAVDVKNAIGLAHDYVKRCLRINAPAESMRECMFRQIEFSRNLLYPRVLHIRGTEKDIIKSVFQSIVRHDHAPYQGGLGIWSRRGLMSEFGSAPGRSDLRLRVLTFLVVDTIIVGIDSISPSFEPNPLELFFHSWTAT